MARQDNLGIQLRSPLNCCIEIVHLEPQENAIPVRPISRIADAPMVVFHAKGMELQDQDAATFESLVLLAAMRALTTQQPLVPAATRFNLAHAYEWLWTHAQVVV
jgi:hypothetical protein